MIEVPFGGADVAVLTRVIRIQKLRKYLSRFRVFLRDKAAVKIDPRSGWRKATQPNYAQLAVENDFVVSTFGPDVAHLIADDLKKINPSLFWVADYRDLWSQNPMIPWSDNIRAKVRSYEEASVGRHADLVTAVSRDMIHKLSEFCKSNFFLSMNGFDLAEGEIKGFFERRTGKRGSPFRIVYTGSIYPGYYDPVPLLESLCNLIDRKELRHEDIRVEFYGANVESLSFLKKNPRYRSFLHIHGYVSRGETLKIQREANLLLLMITSDPQAQGVITGKVFEYISSGSPILCLCPENFEVREVLNCTGTGIAVDGKSLARIESIISGSLNCAGAPDWFSPSLDEICRYTRKGQALALLDEMARLRRERDGTDPSASVDGLDQRE